MFKIYLILLATFFFAFSCGITQKNNSVNFQETSLTPTACAAQKKAWTVEEIYEIGKNQARRDGNLIIEKRDHNVVIFQENCEIIISFRPFINGGVAPGSIFGYIISAETGKILEKLN